MSTSASARSCTAAAGCFRRWKASRCAVLGPIPGRRWSASISRAMAGGWAATRALHQARQLAAQAPGHPRHLARDQLPGLSQGLVGRGEHQVLEHLRIVGRHHLPVDLDRDELLIAVGLDDDHATAGRGFPLLFAHLLLEGLQLGLELLGFFDEIAESLHGASPAGFAGAPARGPGAAPPWVLSPSNSSIAACPTGSVAGAR